MQCHIRFWSSWRGLTLPPTLLPPPVWCIRDSGRCSGSHTRAGGDVQADSYILLGYDGARTHTHTCCVLMTTFSCFLEKERSITLSCNEPPPEYSKAANFPVNLLLCHDQHKHPPNTPTPHPPTTTTPHPPTTTHTSPTYHYHTSPTYHYPHLTHLPLPHLTHLPLPTPHPPTTTTPHPPTTTHTSPTYPHLTYLPTTHLPTSPHLPTHTSPHLPTHTSPHLPTHTSPSYHYPPPHLTYLPTTRLLPEGTSPSSSPSDPP